MWGRVGCRGAVGGGEAAAVQAVVGQVARGGTSGRLLRTWCSLVGRSLHHRLIHPSPVFLVSCPRLQHRGRSTFFGTACRLFERWLVLLLYDSEIQPTLSPLRLLRRSSCFRVCFSLSSSFCLWSRFSLLPWSWLRIAPALYIATMLYCYHPRRIPPSCSSSNLSRHISPIHPHDSIPHAAQHITITTRHTLRYTIKNRKPTAQLLPHSQRRRS